MNKTTSGSKIGTLKSSRGLGTLLLVFVLLSGLFLGQMGPSTAHAQPPAGDVEISMTGPETANIGDTITYNITVKAVNTTFIGPTSVIYSLPYGLTYVSATQTSGTGGGVAFSCSETSGTVSCLTGALVQDVSATIAVVATINNNATPGYYIFNEAQVVTTVPVIVNKYSNSVITHIPTNTTISIKGPSRILPNSTLTYQLVVKNNGAYPVGSVDVFNAIPAGLTYLSADLQNCTLEQGGNPIKGINNGAPPQDGIYCQLDGLAAGESKIISLTFQAGGALGQCFDELATITIYGNPTFKITNQGSMAGDTATANITTCYGDNNTPEPPADLVAQLRVSPDRVVTDSENTDVTYTLTVKNIGYGKAHSVQAKFPFDPSLVIGYASFEEPGAWVSEIGSDPANPFIVVNFPDLDVNAVVSATVVLRPAADATETTEFDRFTVKWDDAVGSGKTAGSNAVRFSIGSEDVNLNNGDVQLFDPAQITLAKDQTQTFTGDFFAPGELVTGWYTDESGQSTSLGTKLADATGTVSFDFSASGHAAGEKFVLAAHGNRSEISGNSAITIGS